MKIKEICKIAILLLMLILPQSSVYTQTNLERIREISSEHYDLLFEKNKVGWVRLETYLARYHGREVYVIEEEMRAVFLRAGNKMETYSKSRVLSDMSDLSPLGYWYEASEGNVKRNMTGVVSKDKKFVEIEIDIGGTKTRKRLDLPKNAIFSNAFEFYIRRNLPEDPSKAKGFSKKLPLIMESDGDIVEGTSVLERDFEHVELCPNAVFRTTTTIAGLKNVEYRRSDGQPVCVIIPTMNIIFVRKDSSTEKDDLSPVDIFEQSLIKPDKYIKNINRLERLRLRLTFSSYEVPPIIEDEYQRVIKREGKSVEIEIRRIRPDIDKKVPFPVKDERFRRYIEPTRYEQSTAEEIIQLAHKFAGNETDIIGAALRVSDQAGKFIKGANLSKGYLSALEVYHNREGDCTEYSVFTSALLKALGIPTRLVMGLVYVDGKFGFHSWLDYWADGWYSIDPTLNEEAVNPTHIRLWTGVGEPSDLRGASVSALNFLKKVNIEVIEAEYK